MQALAALASARPLLLFSFCCACAWDGFEQTSVSKISISISASGRPARTSGFSRTGSWLVAAVNDTTDRSFLTQPDHSFVSSLCRRTQTRASCVRLVLACLAVRALPNPRVAVRQAAGPTAAHEVPVLVVNDDSCKQPRVTSLMQWHAAARRHAILRALPAPIHLQAGSHYGRGSGGQRRRWEATAGTSAIAWRRRPLAAARSDRKAHACICTYVMTLLGRTWVSRYIRRACPSRKEGPGRLE